MKETIYIPKKCKVGFNQRSDTYTGMLGYVIYHDGKVWRKETSWEGWREKHIDAVEFEKKKRQEFDRQVEQQKKTHKEYINLYNLKNTSSSYYEKYAKLTTEQFLKEMRLNDYKNFLYYSPNKESDNPKVIPIEFENKPIEGFVLNKKAGGTKGHSWDTRDTYCRVYDPRGFEFEISIPNLLYILENATSMKGKGLEGKFIYGWEGKDLVLIPEEAPEYKEMVEFTEIQSLKVAKKDLTLGGIYLFNDNSKRTYLGEHEEYNDYNNEPLGKKLWFGWVGNIYHWQKGDETKTQLFHTFPINNVKKYIEQDTNFSTLMDQVVKDKRYKDRKVEYTEITSNSLSALLKSEYSYSDYGRHRDDLCIKEKEKYKKIRVERTRNSKYIISIGRKIEEEFKNTVELLKKYPLWQLKTTK